MNTTNTITTNTNKTNTGRNANLTAGTCLIVAPILTVFAMAHHPSGHGHGTLNRIVHGSMIAILVTLLFGFAHYAIQRGLGKPLVLLGLIGYSINVFSHLIAATMSGFVAPAMLEHGSKNHDLLLLCWEINQASARMGVFTLGLAFVCFGVDLVIQNGALRRVAGILGIAGGVGPVFYLLFVSARMDVPTAFVIYLTHSICTVLVGIILLRSNPST